MTTIPQGEPEFSVGTATVDIFPPPGTRMAGFAARTEPSTGVHDPVSVRALAVEETCWITVDVCGLHERTCREIAAALPLPAANVAVTATHTHAGPCVMPGRLGGHDEKILGQIRAAAVTAAGKAIAGREPAELFYREAAGIGVASNRRHRERAIDPPAQLASFNRADGTVAAWVLLYPCHPVVVGPANRLISGDYPAFARRALEAAAPGSTAFFLPGAAGDVNTGHSAEASYGLAGGTRRTLGEAERIGTLIAEKALASTPRRLRRDEPSSARREVVDLRMAPLDDRAPEDLASGWKAEARATDPGREALLRSWIQWAAQRSPDEDLAWQASVTTFRWGPLTLVGLPGEPFLATAEEIAGAIGGTVMVTGYTNGCPGYLPPCDEYKFGGYEVVDAHRYYGMPAPFAAGSAEKLAHAIVGQALIL
jgi:hypothetical protein